MVFLPPHQLSSIKPVGRSNTHFLYKLVKKDGPLTVMAAAAECFQR